jgi:multisubunit Na+/H+ antiporter MnhG subunit
MATLAARPARMRSDDIFFPAMSLVILGVVYYGFAQSYFLAGMVRAKLPNHLVHIHGAFFVSWIFVLIVQNFLVAAKRIRWHIAVGTLGFILPPLMVVFGVLTLFDSVRRNGVPFLPPALLLTGDLEELAIFAALTTWGLIVRRSAVAHKRLMIVGTMAILGPAINRWPFPDATRLPGTIAVTLGLPLLVVAYDLWSLRKVHKTTIVGTTLIVLASLLLVPISQLSIWQPIVAWIVRHP